MGIITGIWSALKGIFKVITIMPVLIDVAKKLYTVYIEWKLEQERIKREKEREDAFKKAQETGDVDGIENILPRSDAEYNKLRTPANTSSMERESIPLQPDTAAPVQKD